MTRMQKANNTYRTAELCRVFNVKPSRYYYKPVGLREVDINLIALIKVISKASGQTYGKCRICAELRCLGHQIGLQKTKWLMKLAGVVAITPRKRHYYPDSG